MHGEGVRACRVLGRVLHLQQDDLILAGAQDRARHVPARASATSLAVRTAAAGLPDTAPPLVPPPEPGLPTACPPAKHSRHKPCCRAQAQAVPRSPACS